MSNFGNLGKVLTVAAALISTSAEAQNTNQSQATISSTLIGGNGNGDISQNKDSNITSATSNGTTTTGLSPTISNEIGGINPTSYNTSISSGGSNAKGTGGTAVGGPLTANGQSTISGRSADSPVNKSRKPTFIVDKDTAFLLSHGGKTDYQIMVVKYSLPPQDATTTGHTMRDLPFGNESYDTTGGRLEVLCGKDGPSLSVDVNNVPNPAKTAKATYNLLKQNAGAVCLNGQPNNDVVVGLVGKIFPQAFPQTIKRVTFTFQPHP